MNVRIERMRFAYEVVDKCLSIPTFSGISSVSTKRSIEVVTIYTRAVCVRRLHRG